MRVTLLVVLSCICTAPLVAQYSEPKGGLYPTNLLIFTDALNKGIVTTIWGGTAAIDKDEKRNGSASWRWTLNDNGGMHILWGGWTQDTTVFWLHDNSHLSFWIRPGAGKMRFSVYLGYNEGQHEVIPMQEIGAAGVWKYYDVLVPASALRKGLNDVKFLFTGISGSATVHLDDLKLSDVRLYAGKGNPTPLKGIFADQIGYDTYGIKRFSSEPFTSYQIVRVSDNKVMFTGTEGKLMTHPAIDPYSVYTADFTKFETPGKYFIRLDNGTTSYPFEIGPNVYDATVRAAVRFFYYQRNNTAITMPYAEGPWVHEKDEKEVVLNPPSMGGTRIVRKGWHDAGDFAIYMPNHTYTCFWIAAAWEDFRYDSDNLNIPESGNGIPDIIDELRWGIDWIFDMQDTTDGGFFHNMCMRKNSPYTYGKTTALTITGYELTNKTTPATAAATGLLAYASRVFEPFDKPYAERMRRAAKRGWKYLQAHPEQINVTENCQTYHDADDIQARVFAAAGLFLATGEPEYHRYFLQKDPGSQWISDYVTQTNLAYIMYLKSPNADPKKKADLRNLLITRAQEANNDRDRHPFGFVGYYYWGSLGTAFARVGNYNLVDWLLNKNTNSMFTALQQLHYTFGQNSLGFVYFSGFGVKGMTHSFHNWLKALNATPHNFPGLLAGGPNEKPDPNEKNLGEFGTYYNKPPDTPIDQRYVDGDSWSTNEIAVNQNAHILYVLCAAYAYAHGKR